MRPPADNRSLGTITRRANIIINMNLASKLPPQQEWLMNRPSEPTLRGSIEKDTHARPDGKISRAVST